MDVRLTSEQRQLRDVAAKLSDDLGPGSVQDLDDDVRTARLEKAVDATGWRSLRSDGASGVEVAIVAEEFGRRLLDVAFIGPVLADDLAGHVEYDVQHATVAVGDSAIDARGCSHGLQLHSTTLVSMELDDHRTGVDLTRITAVRANAPVDLGNVSDEAAARCLALALVATSADLVGTARGAQTAAVDYAKIRQQYGNTIGSYQAVAHLLAESLALIEGSISVLRHAAWAVDELPVAKAVHAARIAKIYCARTALTVCETAIQVHGGIGNTWECLAHVYLRRALTSADWFPAKLEEIDLGLS